MKTLFFLLATAAMCIAQPERPKLGNLPLKINIEQVTNLPAELAKKSEKGRIDYDGEIATDMYLVNTTTKHLLRIFLGAGQSDYRTAPSSRDMFVNVDASIMAMPNDYTMISANAEMSEYCYNVTSAGPTGPVTQKKTAPFKFRIWSSETYKPNKKLFLMAIDSLKSPLSQHKSCTSRYQFYYLYEFYTTAPYFPLYVQSWASGDFRKRTREGLYPYNLSRRHKASPKQGYIIMASLFTTPHSSTARLGRRCDQVQHCFTHEPTQV